MSEMSKFWKDIKKFNEMYKLNSSDELQTIERSSLINFQDILQEELNEGDEIIQNFDKDNLDKAVELADWLGDIVVYCHTFADQNGINLPEVLDVIMKSNFSKLGEDGEPIYDHRGKVMKGPYYWRPEPKIKALLDDTAEVEHE